MAQRTDTRSISRRAYVTFLIVVSALVALMAAGAWMLQREMIRYEAERELNKDLKLIGELATESLLRSDYTAVEREVLSWPERNRDIVSIRAVMPNGFVLAEFNREQPARVPIEASNAVTFGGREILTVRGVLDLEEVERRLQMGVYVALGAIVAGIFVIGSIVWATLERAAIRPLERHISLGAEREGDLERRVAERTSELTLALDFGGVWIWDTNLRTGEVRLSEGWSRLLGGPPRVTHTTLDSLQALVHPDDLPEFRRISTEVLKGLRTHFVVEHRVRTHSGEWRWVLSRGRVAERDARGWAVRMAGANSDITERKLAETALARNEARFRDLTALSSDWYWEQDENFRFVWHGTAWRSERNQPPRYVGLTRWEAHPHSLSPEQWGAHRAQLEAHQSFRDLEFKSLGRDGVMRWVSISGQPIFDESGTFRGYRGVGQDISQRKLAEEAVLMSEARFRDFAQASGDWFWETDADHRFVWVSDAMSRFTGTPESRYIGSTPADLAAPGTDFSVEPWRTFLAAVARREPYRDFLFRRLAPSGTLWINASGTPFYDSDGRFLGYRGASADVTSRVEAERRARDAEDRLRAAVEDMNEGFCLCDPEDRIVFANRQFREANPGLEEYLAPGRRYEEHERAGIALGYYPAALGREEAWLAERSAQRRNPVGAVERQRQGGMWLLVSDQRLPDGSSVTFGLNISERKRADDAVRESAARMESLSRRLLSAQEEERRNLARELHDELGQSLSAARMHFQSAARKALGSALEARLGEGLVVLDHALDELRSIARGLRPAQLDDLGLASALRAHIERSYSGNSPRVTLQADEPLPTLPEAIPIAGFRIAQEAIHNAVRHASARRVQVSLVARDGELCVRVEDDGRGFDVAASRASARAGASIGLAGMEERAELAGGRLDLRSAPGHGTRIEARFSLRQSAE